MNLKATHISKKYIGNGLSIALLLAIFLSGLSFSNARGENPTAVSLIYFRGQGQDSAVVLEWATATELDTVGFEIERALQLEGPFQRLSAIGFVPSLASDAFSGAEYEVRDEDGVNNGQNYFYILIEIELDGTENRTQPIVVTAGQTQAPPTVTSTIAQSTGTTVPSSPSSTPQRTPTRTPTPQVTSQASSGEQTTGSTSGAGATATILSRTINQNPTSTSGVASANSDTSSGNNTTVSNQAQAQPTGEGYPAPLVTPVLPGSELSYPSLAPDSIEQPFQVNPSAYPGAAPENIPPPSAPNFGTAPAIGSDSSPATVDDSEMASSNPSDRLASTFVLWIGFIIALLIFVLGIVGAIYWYSRQRTG